MKTDLVAVAKRWMTNDPDPDTRSATEAMLGDPGRLATFFGGRLEFGTAGLRGVHRSVGTNRMNRALVRSGAPPLRSRATVQAPPIGPASPRVVVIGYVTVRSLQQSSSPQDAARGALRARGHS
jgi:phosphomannomutase